MKRDFSPSWGKSEIHRNCPKLGQFPMKKQNRPQVVDDSLLHQKLPQVVAVSNEFKFPLPNPKTPHKTNP